MRAILAIAAAAALACTGCSKKEAPPAAEPKAEASTRNSVEMSEAAQRGAGIRVQPAVERAQPETVRSNAHLTNNEELTWRVGAITDGRVMQVLAAPGDTVKKGATLARIHSHDVHDSRAQFRSAVSELQRAKAGVVYAERVLDRAKRLLNLKAASLEQVEHAEAELQNAKAAQSSAESEVERHRAHLEEFLGVSAEEASHGHTPGDTTDEQDLIPVNAPASGVVILRNVTAGTVVTPSSDMFVISDLQSIWAIAEVNEEQLPKLRPGMAARIRVQAWGDREFTGRIAKLGESLDPATRTVKVRVVLSNPNGLLKPEMYASAEIDVGASRKAVFVPSEATQEVRGQTVVFVRTTASRFEPRPVELGRSVEGLVEIVRGLAAGEQVVIAGTFVVKSEFLKASLAEE